MKTLIISQKNEKQEREYASVLNEELDTLINLQDSISIESKYDQESNLNIGTNILTNIYEYDDEYELRLLAPGLDKSNIEIDVDHDNVLTICAETEPEDEEMSNNCIRRDFYDQGFTQTYQLPENILAEEISAEYHKGIISLFIPKNEEIITENLLEIIID